MFAIYACFTVVDNHYVDIINQQFDGYFAKQTCAQKIFCTQTLCMYLKPSTDIKILTFFEKKYRGWGCGSQKWTFNVIKF